jgi:hypothetical protein
MQAAENRASQGGKRSQRRKQNCEAILRLREFFDGLGTFVLIFTSSYCFSHANSL